MSAESHAAVQLSDVESLGPAVRYDEWLASDESAREDPDLGGVVVWRHKYVRDVALDTATFSSAFLWR